jgi:hypothetical protein
MNPYEPQLSHIKSPTSPRSKRSKKPWRVSNGLGEPIHGTTGELRDLFLVGGYYYNMVYIYILPTIKGYIIYILLLMDINVGY